MGGNGEVEGVAGVRRGSCVGVLNAVEVVEVVEVMGLGGLVSEV